MLIYMAMLNSQEMCCYITPIRGKYCCQNGLFDSSSLVLPHVILWDPIQLYTMYFTQVIICCPESGCGQQLSIFRWNTGSSAGHCLCIIHDIQHVTLLVAAVYKCENGHETLSTDPQILDLFLEHVPFILFHRSGVTRAFCHMVIELASYRRNEFYCYRTLHSLTENGPNSIHEATN